MKLWNKENSLNERIEKFTVGKDRVYDLYIAKYDVIASIAHAKMLNKIGILKNDESEKILNILNEIGKNISSGNFNIENEFEDVHSKIESILIKHLGVIGKKIHTGRSRNDQVLVATQLFLKDEILLIKELTVKLFDTLLNLAKKNKNKLKTDLIKLRNYKSLILLIALATILFMTANYGYLYLVNNQKAAIVAILTAIYPIITLILGYKYFNETLTKYEFIGFMLVLLGIFFINYKN